MKAKRKVWIIAGLIYKAIYKIPIIGKRFVRYSNRGIGYFGSFAPLGIKGSDSIDEFESCFNRLMDRMGFKTGTISTGDESMQVAVYECPYGYREPEDRGVCDAVMDMDRTMFRHCGYELVVDESMPEGGPYCKMTFYKKVK